MTITIDARELRTTTGRYVERLLHYLQKLDDNQHEYIVLLKPEDMAGWKPTNPHFKVIACPYKEFTFSEQLGFLRQLNSLKSDLVHFTMTQQPVLYRGKTITTIHDLTTARIRNPYKNWIIFTIKQRVYRWVIKKVAKKSKIILVPTNFVKKDVAEYSGIPGRKIVVTYEAADKVEAKPEPIKKLVGKQFIFYVGRALPHKNLQRLVEAYSIVHQTYPQLQLVLAGKFDSGYKSLQKYTIDKNLPPPLFLGFVSDKQLSWLYQNTEAYVFPSLSEGFGLPGLEAMLNGAPVISSNSTCLPELYGDAAFYFDPYNVDDMAAKILEVINSPKLKTDLIRRGRQQATKYSWKKTAELTLEQYQKVLAK